MPLDHKDNIRSDALVTGLTELPDDVLRMASLTVCDPARKLSAEEASEVLKALGLMYDPKHVEMQNYYGYNRRKD